MSNENKPNQSTDLSKFEVYDEAEQGPYEDPNTDYPETEAQEQDSQEASDD